MTKLGARFFLLLFQMLTAGAFAAKSQQSADLIQLQADTFNTNLETRKTEMSGNVHLVLADRDLRADKLTIDPQTGDVECQGDILFTQGALSIRAKGVKFNLKTGLGVFYNAAVNRSGAFKLEGKEIERIDDKTFKAKVAKISFCQDCPESWSLVGDKVQVNTERYAELHHAVLQIKDVPIMYLPFIYYPAKDQRFSGFLIPYFKFSTALGAQIGVPFFYAATDNLDFTWDYRYMSRGGHRNKVDTRYRFSDKSYFDTSTAWIRTPPASQWERDRFGIHYDGHVQAFTNWAFLAKGDYVSDVLMSSNFEEDSIESRLPTLSNDFAVESQYDNIAASAGISIPENNLDRSQATRGNVRWTLPQVRVGTPLTPLAPNFLGGLRFEELSVRRFRDTPTGGEVGRDPVTNYIASGDRYSSLVDLALPVNFDFVRSTTTAHYRGDYYTFGPGVEAHTATRSRFAFEQTLETDFSRIFDMGWQDMPRLKHVLTPYVTYAYSPTEMQSNHEFFQEIPGSPATAPRFDLYDGSKPNENISLGTEEAERLLRHHSLFVYGMKTQLLGKFASDKMIREILFLNISHEYDFLTNQTGKFRIGAEGNYGGIAINSQIAWDPHSNQTDLLNDLTIERKYFDLTFYQNIRPGADNLGGELRVKKIGPFEIATYENFDRRKGQLIEQRHFVSYASASQCWRIDLGLKRRAGDNDFEYSPSVQVVYSESLKNREALTHF